MRFSEYGLPGHRWYYNFLLLNSYKLYGAIARNVASFLTN
ncbi:hypothetical protein BN1221_02453 [Brenneria goodwinii]|uniref:Uncharacterized protein n=1 Tax=Brenneria goodwinii TaxID=1109412 RepID=A0A0G4JWA7_9GAMM|nr:hypothetical protein BN1221_02453 [Brenneria goodwinii]